MSTLRLIAALSFASIWLSLTLVLIASAWRNYRRDQLHMNNRLQFRARRVLASANATEKPPMKITRRIIQKPFAMSA